MDILNEYSKMIKPEPKEKVYKTSLGAGTRVYITTPDGKEISIGEVTGSTFTLDKAPTQGQEITIAYQREMRGSFTLDNTYISPEMIRKIMPLPGGTTRK